MNYWFRIKCENSIRESSGVNRMFTAYANFFPTLYCHEKRFVISFGPLFVTRTSIFRRVKVDFFFGVPRKLLESFTKIFRCFILFFKSSRCNKKILKSFECLKQKTWQKSALSAKMEICIIVFHILFCHAEKKETC